jgi:TonB family protein
MIMKTKERSHALVYLKLALVLPVIAIVMIAFPSCRDKPKGTITAGELIVPPPPPPPPPFTVREGDTIWNVVDVKPLYKGGDEALREYIGKHIMYPNDAASNNIQGIVVASFVVETDCSISRVNVLKGVHPELDMEAVRVIKTLPAFQSPGYKNNRPVPVLNIIPISFKLN